MLKYNLISRLVYRLIPESIRYRWAMIKLNLYLDSYRDRLVMVTEFKITWYAPSSMDNVQGSFVLSYFGVNAESRIELDFPFCLIERQAVSLIAYEVKQ